MQKIAITGHSGFIGSYLFDDFKEKYRCQGISRSMGIDIGNYEELEGLDFDPEIIIHAAATANGNFEENFQNNVIGTLNICKYAKAKKVKHLILISSIFGIDREENGYFNAYGKTKKISEDMAKAFCEENGIKLTILRCAQVYDDRGVAKSAQAMLYYFIETIRDKKSISLFGTKNPLRNYIHIDYLTAIIKDVIEKSRYGTFNIVENKNHTIAEIAYMIFDLLRLQPNITLLQDKPDIPSVYIPTDDRYIGDIQSIALRDGIQRILNHGK